MEPPGYDEKMPRVLNNPAFQTDEVYIEQIAGPENPENGAKSSGKGDKRSDMVFQNNAPFGKGLFDFPPHPEVGFDTVYMEPESYLENKVGKTCGGWTRRIFGAIYEYTQVGMYYGLVIILGIFLSFAWGILIGTNNFLIVWIIQPLFKLTFAWTRVISVLWQGTIRTMIDPVYESVGQMFSFIRATFTMNVPEFLHFVNFQQGKSKAIHSV